MRKLKLLFTALALLGGVNLANAQTDVTSTYMTNPSFEAANATTGDISATGVFTNDWNITSINYARVAVFNASSTISTFGGTTSVSNGNYYLMIRSNLDQGKTQNIRQNSDMNLPKGKYTISFDYKAARVKNVNRKFTISAINSNGNTTYGSKAIDIPLKSASDTYFSGIEWSTASFEFTHESATNTRINISCETQGTANDKNSKHTVVLLDNFVIQYSNINKEILAALIAQATSINTAKGGLNEAIAAAQDVYDEINDTPEYQDDIDDAISTLKNAITTVVNGISLSHGTDLTYLIANAGFEGMTAETEDYSTVKGKDYTDEGWILDTTCDSGYGAVLTYNSGLKVNGAVIPEEDNAGNSGKALGLSVGWGGTQLYKTTVPITLPAGKYILKVYGYNAGTSTTLTSKFGFVPTSGNAVLSTKTSYEMNQWGSEEVIIELGEETEGCFQIGGTAVSGSGSDNTAKVFYDNITLTYVTDEGLELSAAYEKLDNLITLATDEMNYSVGTKTNIESAIATATSNKDNCTLASELEDLYNTLETARQTYVTSGALPTEGHSFDYTFKIADAAVTSVDAWTGSNVAENANYTGAPDVFCLNHGWDKNASNQRQTVSGLPAGIYEVTAITRGSGVSANVYVNDGTNNYSTNVENNGGDATAGQFGYGWSLTSVPFKLETSANVTIGFYTYSTKDTQNWANADNFHLYYYGPASMTATVTDAGMATFCSPYALDFTDMGVKAYTASLTGDEGDKTVLLTRVYQVPAETGLVLKGAAADYEIPVIASADPIEGNLMVGTLNKTPVAASEGGSYNYMLASGTNGVGFYCVEEATTSAAGKAYLHTTEPLKNETNETPGSRIALIFSDEGATGIESVNADNGKAVYYDLQGRQVSKPSKGMYIINGKKVIK